eukprot:scaffold6237_cov108-Skeletonema_marinoi.AAC.1
MDAWACRSQKIKIREVEELFAAIKKFDGNNNTLDNSVKALIMTAFNATALLLCFYPHSAMPMVQLSTTRRRAICVCSSARPSVTTRSSKLSVF